MPVTLAQAKQNAATHADGAIIDEFRTSRLLDRMVFDNAVNPQGGGGTLTYGYRRLATLSTAGFRPINTEYTPTEATTTQHVTELKPLGGSFQIDRVLARVGPAATGEVALQSRQKVRAAQAMFADAMINGDSDTEPDGFDGLSKILTGSSTERDASSVDVSGAMSEDKAYEILEAIDSLVALTDEMPTMLVGPRAFVERAQAAARRLAQYTDAPSPVVANNIGFNYGGVLITDAGRKAGDNTPIIPVESDGTADIYAIRVGLDGFHGVSMAGAPLVQYWPPNFNTPGAVKTGEVEMGPVAVALKATKAAAVLRGVKVSAGA